MKSNEEFELDADDAAIVFKKDMSTEIYIPKVKEDDLVNFDENQNVFVSIAIMSSMNDVEFRDLISKKMDELFTKMTSEEEEEKCPPSNCGSCCGCGPEETKEDDN